MDGDRQNKDLLGLAFELSPAGMLVVDAAGKILLVNREIERLFGVSGLKLAQEVRRTRPELLGRDP